MRFDRVAIALGVLIVMLIALDRSLLAENFRRSMEQTRKALAVADDWRATARKWERVAARFEAVANDALKVAAENREAAKVAVDEFLVCESMLPAALRRR